MFFVEAQWLGRPQSLDPVPLLRSSLSVGPKWVVFQNCSSNCRPPMIYKVSHHGGLCTASVDYVVFVLVEPGAHVVAGLSNIFHPTGRTGNEVNEILYIFFVLLNYECLISYVVLCPFQL